MIRLRSSTKSKIEIAVLAGGLRFNRTVAETCNDTGGFGEVPDDVQMKPAKSGADVGLCKHSPDGMCHNTTAMG